LKGELSFDGLGGSTAGNVSSKGGFGRSTFFSACQEPPGSGSAMPVPMFMLLSATILGH
jgi:hypothetical protein